MNDEINESRQSSLPHGAGILIAGAAGVLFWVIVIVAVML